MKEFIEVIIETKNGKPLQPKKVLNVIPVELSKQSSHSKSDNENGARSSEPRYFLRIDKQKLPNVKDFGKVRISAGFWVLCCFSMILHSRMIYTLSAHLLHLNQAVHIGECSPRVCGMVSLLRIALKLLPSVICLTLAAKSLAMLCMAPICLRFLSCSMHLPRQSWPLPH